MNQEAPLLVAGRKSLPAILLKQPRYRTYIASLLPGIIEARLVQLISQETWH